MPTKKETPPDSPQVAYLKSQGIEVDAEVVDARPDIGAMLTAVARPWDYVNAEGNAVPKEAGLEFYAVGGPVEKQAGWIKLKKAQGFHVMKGEHGHQRRGIKEDGETLMYRTHAVRDDHAKAKRLMEMDRRKKKTTTNGSFGDGGDGITEDHHAETRSVPRR